MVAIDRHKVSDSFDSHASEYDSYAVVQKRVIERFSEIYLESSGAPNRILDIGSGTGVLLNALAGRFPVAEPVGLDIAFGMCQSTLTRLSEGGRGWVCRGDAESLPFAGNSFDMVVSTSALQWLEELSSAFSEVFRVLSPGGVFCLALFGEATLHELRESYRKASELAGYGFEQRTHIFFSPDYIAEALRIAGFCKEEIRSELETELYPDVPSLLRNLRRIGAGNASTRHLPGLAGRQVMLSMMDIYRESYGKGSDIPATYQVIYASGRKPLQ
jgi:malonyl-CoA O-methyltransferase